MSFEPPGYCPNCGDFVAKGETACESCGSCSDTGWSEDSLYDGIDLPSEADEPVDGPAHTRLLSAVVSLGLLAFLVYVLVFL